MYSSGKPRAPGGGRVKCRLICEIVNILQPLHYLGDSFRTLVLNHEDGHVSPHEGHSHNPSTVNVTLKEFSDFHESSLCNLHRSLAPRYFHCPGKELSLPYPLLPNPSKHYSRRFACFRCCAKQLELLAIYTWFLSLRTVSKAHTLYC